MGSTENMDQLSVLFRALTHPARLAILEAFREGEQCVCHLEAHLGYRQAYISQQLSVLREAGLIEDRRDGWNIFYRVLRPEVFGLIDQAASLAGTRRTAANTAGRPVDCPCPKCAALRRAPRTAQGESPCAYTSNPSTASSSGSSNNKRRNTK
jgi:DNA-binding transcriptional ArsR family regulator